MTDTELLDAVAARLHERRAAPAAVKGVMVFQVALAPRVRPRTFSGATGLTLKAIEGKIASGKWLEGREYHRDPDGCIWIDVKGVMDWISPSRP